MFVEETSSRVRDSGYEKPQQRYRKTTTGPWVGKDSPRSYTEYVLSVSRCRLRDGNLDLQGLGSGAWKFAAGETNALFELHLRGLSSSLIKASWTPSILFFMSLIYVKLDIGVYVSEKMYTYKKIDMRFFLVPLETLSRINTRKILSGA
jgi:hypothetical protein